MMRSSTLLYAIVILLSSFWFIEGKSTFANNIPKRIAAFYGSWSKTDNPPYSAAQIPYTKLTHIIHAGAGLNDAGDGTFTVPSNFIELELLNKSHAAGVKVEFYMGGSEAAYKKMASSASSRATFVKGISEFIQNYSYDGMDIDWEYPQSNTDKANFYSLMSAIRTALPSPKYVISIDVPNIPNPYYGFDQLKQVVDMFNIMLYDCAGPWTGYAELNSPIFNDTSNPSPQGSADQSATCFTDDLGVPADQLNMGTPFYGYYYTKLTYLYEICQPCTSGNVISETYGTYIKQRINAQGWVRHFDNMAQVPYLLHSDGSDGFITYDDYNSTYTRVSYSVYTRGLGGSFMWSLDQDYDGTTQDLLDAMYNATMSQSFNVF